MGSTAILWFRRDLRLGDNPALAHALASADTVEPVFVLDDNLLHGRWPSPNRVWFMARSLHALAADLAARGSRLTVLRGRPGELLPQFAAEVAASSVVVSRDYAPYGRRRDLVVAERLQERGIAFERQPGVLVHEPEEVLRAEGGHFKVFSPFQRAWQALDRRPVLAAPERMPAPVGRQGRGSARAALDDLLRASRPSADERLIPVPGEAAARARLDDWAESDALKQYDGGRDRLDRAGTSRLSQDLRWGLLSPVEVLERTSGAGNGRQRFASEICWRDFYAHLLWHQAELATKSFRRELDDVAWRRADDPAVDAWREGRTGYPVVDAAMRQLRESGWVHNRGRMIAASFLTKHLGVDWRVGEAHFMSHLTDGDPASNNGGWQWASSTGTDPQPYFRVFNPTLQRERYDPSGDYVRRWLPDPEADFPPPLVDHAEARREAIARYEQRSRTGPHRG
ncbi:MAG TPA: deoxyribodipyrimidine photo-lyase [Candidatus Limnocylindrales bacterium]|nr:deoxyribodipyrimidine photo-lyase [Candidatus Limnocylindrales bacterium]